MRGISIATRSGNKKIDMCVRCYNKEEADIQLALELGLIRNPIVTHIKKCEIFCEDDDEKHIC